MKDLMLDLETMGTGPNAPITQIGACFFDRRTGDIGDKFKINISLSDSEALGFEKDLGAIKFWEKNAHAATFYSDPDPIDCVTAAMRFTDFLALRKPLIWSHATFDFCLLTNFYHRLQIKPPFMYNVGRDIRTLVDLAPKYQKDDDLIRAGAHDALADCIWQVGYVHRAINSLRGGDL